MKELHDLAGQHEVIAENTQGNVMKDLSNLIQDYKQDRKKVTLKIFIPYNIFRLYGIYRWIMPIKLGISLLKTPNFELSSG